MAYRLPADSILVQTPKELLFVVSSRNIVQLSIEQQGELYGRPLIEERIKFSACNIGED